MTDLLQKDQIWCWGEKEQRLFNNLKQMITSAPILTVLNVKLPFILTTDASDKAVGGVLSQKVNGVEKPIAFCL